MAVVSPVPALPHQIERLALHDFGSSGSMGSREIDENPPPIVVEDKIFVAVGKDLKESKFILSWAVQNSGGRKICIIHVHQPAQMIPFMGGKLPANKVKEQEVRAYRDVERQNMHKILNEYLNICSRVGVLAEKLDIEMDNVETGIVELVANHGIKKLVMGAAANKHCSKRMRELKSRKAIFVRQHAHLSCHIWFVCKGHLIYTREGSLDGTETEVTPLSLLASPITGTGQSTHLRSRSTATPRQSNFVRLTNPVENFLFRRARSVQFESGGERFAATSSPGGTGGGTTPQSPFGTEGIDSEQKGLSRSSSSQDSAISTWTSSEVADTLDLVSEVKDEVSVDGISLPSAIEYNEDLQISASPSERDLVRVNDEMYDQIKQAMMEAENSQREAFEESLRRRKAEKDAIEAIRKAKAAESLHNEEMKKRKETEEALAREKQELDKMKNQRDEVVEELRRVQDQVAEMESLITDSERTIKELEEKIVSAVELLITVKRERDELQIDHDHAFKEAEELRERRKEEATSLHRSEFFSEFSFLEIEEATGQCDPSLKIGEGGYGSVYKGIIRHTQVAVKMLHAHNLQRWTEFQQEVHVLSRVRHPNLLTLIGACPEAWALVYEYHPNGSLEDRLMCRDNSAPLSWQTRTRIATEMCSALIFLHSNKPHSIVHGDLKPANILLDANFMSKLGDFGICRFIPRDGNSSNTTPCCRTGPKGTLAYMDPEFLSTDELPLKSDVYSFGVILLRLLTGRPALGLVKEVQYALEKGNLYSVLDASAGDWPYVQAKQLAHLALRCCEMNWKSRPDLETEVWRVLEPMRDSCGASSSFRLSSGEHCRIPSYFICPIFQEIMTDPQVAADGFTYEAEAMRGWLDSGHDTSPMTNLKLAHCNLLPNRALRSAIQEWLQQP